MNFGDMLSLVTLIGLVLNIANQNRLSKKDLIAPVKESVDGLKKSFDTYCSANKNDLSRIYDHISNKNEKLDIKTSTKIDALRNDFTACQLTHASINRNGIKK